MDDVVDRLPDRNALAQLTLLAGCFDRDGDIGRLRKRGHGRECEEHRQDDTEVRFDGNGDLGR